MVRKLIVAVCVVGISMAGAGELYAQQNLLTSSIAKTYSIDGDDVESGDIIAHDDESDRYRLARPGDEDVAGVVVHDPLLLLDNGNGGIPVVSTGELLVNVTTASGAIAINDFITVSPIPGKGMGARSGDIVIGVAKEPFSLEEALLTVVQNGEEIGIGVIRAQVNVGSGVVLPTRGGTLDLGKPSLGAPGGSVLDILKYAAAILIAVGSLYIAFRNFGANIRNSIVSIGRNPLAKTSIQSMVLVNILLVLLVGVGGLFLSLAILLLPT